MDRARQLMKWAETVSQCRNCGKTVATWCAEYGITTKTYYRLKRVCEAIPEDKEPLSQYYINHVFSTEVDISFGLPIFEIVGLPDAAVNGEPRPCTGRREELRLRLPCEAYDYQ